MGHQSWPHSAATAISVSAVRKLHRPDALPLVLNELETARAVGIADVAAARLAVQTATGSENPPGGVLHVLAIGLDTFGKKAGSLQLSYAAEDARDVANALLMSQKIAVGKATLYGSVSIEYLANEKADGLSIFEAMGRMASVMGKGGPDQDLAVILFSNFMEK